MKIEPGVLYRYVNDNNTVGFVYNGKDIFDVVDKIQNGEVFLVIESFVGSLLQIPCTKALVLSPRASGWVYLVKGGGFERVRI